MNNTQQKVVVIGANSAIAMGVCKIYAKENYTFFLVARSEEKLQENARELMKLGAKHVSIYIADLLNKHGHEAIVTQAIADMGIPDIVLVAHGVLPDNERAYQDVEYALETLMINAVSAISIIQRFALILEKNGRGTIAAISSVAGDRARKGIFVYSASKAALSTYCDGLRQKLRSKGVNVLTIKPGPVDTPMVSGREMPLKADVHVVAEQIVDAIQKRARTLYVPGIWRIIMAVVKLLPEAIVERTKF